MLLENKHVILEFIFLLSIVVCVFTQKKSRGYQYIQGPKGERILCLVFGLCSLPGILTQKPALMSVYHQWSQLEFAYDSPQKRQHDIDTGVFIPGIPAPIDVDVYYSPDNNHNQIFVTIPRFQAGIPATLGMVMQNNTNSNPIIEPYPSWSWQTNPGKCQPNRIVSVYRIQIDECDRLWVLDTGRLLEEQVCPPQLLAFDLRTNQLILKYEIPADQLESRSILVTPIVDVRDAHLKCRDTFVYMADCQTYSIIVFDMHSKTSWRVSDKTMYPYPNYGTYSIQGDSFDLMDGVLGMALEPYVPGRDRKLFYHAMSSPTENWVYTGFLRNHTRFLHNPSSSPEIFTTYRGQRHTQSAAEAMDKNGIMFFGLMSDVKIACWNINTEYGDNSIDTVADNVKTLQFASGVKVIQNRKRVQELWVMTSRFQKVATGTLSTSEINFRIHAAKVDDLLFNNKCKSRKQSGVHFSTTGTSGTGGGGGYGLRPKPMRFS